MYSKDTDLRKASAMFICELVHQEPQAQSMICKAMDFAPLEGKVSINKFPAKIENIIAQRPQVLRMLQKKEASTAKFWCFPPLDSSSYRAALENSIFFPDPLEYLIGFFYTAPKYSPAKFIDTTTSYISNNSLSEENKNSTPRPKRKAVTPTREVKTERRRFREPVPYSTHLYSREDPGMQAAPFEVSSPSKPMVKPSAISRNSPRYQGVEASISRIKGTLKEISKQSPRKNYLTPTAASSLKSKSPPPSSLASRRRELLSKAEKLIKTPKTKR